ncbi:hypothetical protein [Polaromonas sp. YR568]|uniref:hypothetical protein n=1 Tax=Polaromonas sp. YR568 TaxID=1855301 RepID=UPI00398BCAB7
MNEPVKLIPSFFVIRPQLVSGGCLALVVFITVLLFVNFLLNGILFSRFWPSFGLALATLALGIVTVRRGFVKTQKKRQLVFASIVLSIGALTMAPIFFTQGIQHALTYANFYFVKDAYLQKVAMVERAEAPRFITFRWDSFHEEFLIFDESDGLDNGDGVKSRDWWLRAKEQQYRLAVCDWSSMKVAEHFYRVSFNCEYPYSGSSIPLL